MHSTKEATIRGHGSRARPSGTGCSLERAESRSNRKLRKGRRERDGHAATELLLASQRTSEEALGLDLDDLPYHALRDVTIGVRTERDMRRPLLVAQIHRDARVHDRSVREIPDL
jgi:hypothetical protein